MFPNTCRFVCLKQKTFCKHNLCPKPETKAKQTTRAEPVLRGLYVYMTCSSYLHEYVIVDTEELSVSIKLWKSSPSRINIFIHPVLSFSCKKNADPCAGKCCFAGLRSYIIVPIEASAAPTPSIDNTRQEQMQLVQYNGLWQRGITASASEKCLFICVLLGMAIKGMTYIE